MIKKRVKVILNGLMAENILEIGLTGSNMVRALISRQIIKEKKVSGKKERE